jgi:hypothetical protein
MGRYARGAYGTVKYGLDLWSEYSVEPMVARITVDPHFSTVASYTNDNGQSVYDRVEVSWLMPSTVGNFQLLRSNLGFPTSHVDPFATVLVNNTPSAQPSINLLPGDPQGRIRRAYLDTAVEPGREYFYTVWVDTGTEWVRSGQASVITSSDHGMLDALKGALPPYIWNQYSGPGDGVAVQADDDDENHMTRWLQSCAWELDQSLTRIDLLRKVWDPQYTPAALLDDAVRMYGLPVEPALGARAQRALLTNAAEITGERGSLNAVSLLVESLTGFNCTLRVGKNRINNTDESSFEGVTVVAGSSVIESGMGRWYPTNSAATRIGGDTSSAPAQIARDTNSGEDYGDSSTRWAVRLTAVANSTDISMTLGDKVRVSKYVSDTQYSTITTKWVHGLEAGDSVTLSLNGGTTTYTVVVTGVIDDFNIQIDAAAAGAPVSTTSSPTDGYLAGAVIRSYQGIPVEAGEIYSLVGVFKSASTAHVTLQMNYYDRFGSALAPQSVTWPSTVSSTVWTTVSVAGTAPANAAVATLTITLPQTGAAQYLDIDSLMVAPGGTTYTSSLAYDSGTVYAGSFDYSFEDARLLIITVDTTHNLNGGVVPVTILADLIAIIQSRLSKILAAYLPVGTAFLVNII